MVNVTATLNYTLEVIVILTTPIFGRKGLEKATNSDIRYSMSGRADHPKSSDYDKSNHPNSLGFSINSMWNQAPTLDRGGNQGQRMANRQMHSTQLHIHESFKAATDQYVDFC